MKTVNIGAGITRIDNFINIDIAPYADISIDLNKDRIPIESNSIDLAFSYHTLEHCTEYLFALSEIHRILKHGAILYIGVPYLTLTKYNLVNPYHKQNFNEYSFDFFDRDKLLGSAAETGGIEFKKIFHRFHYMPKFEKASEKRKEWCREHLLNTVQKIDFGLVAIKDSTPMNMQDYDVEQCKRQFDDILSRRKYYTEAQKKSHNQSTPAV